MSYRRRDPEAKADLVEFMQGAVPRTDIKWGHLAAGLTIGYLIGREMKRMIR
jgi:hypothetical protein